MFNVSDHVTSNTRWAVTWHHTQTEMYQWRRTRDEALPWQWIQTEIISWHYRHYGNKCWLNQSQYRSSLVSYKVWRYLFPSERVQLKQTEWSHRWCVTRPPRARVAARGNLSLWLVWNLNQNHAYFSRWQPLLWPTGSMPNISCYYKCGLSALPGKLCHRFNIFSR